MIARNKQNLRLSICDAWDILLKLGKIAWKPPKVLKKEVWPFAKVCWSHARQQKATARQSQNDCQYIDLTSATLLLINSRVQCQFIRLHFILHLCSPMLAVFEGWLVSFSHWRLKRTQLYWCCLFPTEPSLWNISQSFCQMHFVIEFPFLTIRITHLSGCRFLIVLLSKE